MKASEYLKLTLTLHAQAMDVPADIWGIVREKTPPTDWVKACGFSRESFAMQWKFLVAELCTKRAIHRRIRLGQLQLNEWHTCHFLYLNLWRLGDIVRLSTSQSKKVASASRKLPLLHYMHLVGRSQVTVTESSIEGMLVRLLARHTLVLTLQVHAMKMPWEPLPNLQHLVLKLDAIPLWIGERQTHGSVFSDISMLKGLKTLYVHFPRPSGVIMIDGSADMTACVHLHRVVLQGVEPRCKLALPAGCSLHAICDLNYPGHFRIFGHQVGRLVTELSWHCTSCRWTLGHWPWEVSPRMRNLTKLRVNVLEGVCDGKVGEDRLMIIPDTTPNLEELELHTNCNMTLHIDSSLPLQSLLVIAAGFLHLDEMQYGGRPAPLAALKRMYLQSGVPLEPDYRDRLKVLDTSVHWAGKRLFEFIREEPSSWRAVMPARLQPGNLQECCCGACPECLARAGVPIPWKQAWTDGGTEKRVRSSFKCGR